MSSVKLHDWQREFLDSFRRSSEDNYLLAALPGAGKTIAALECANEFVLGNPGGRIIVVAPSSHLRRQWRDAAHRHYGMELQTAEFRGSLKQGGFCGLVTTYAAVAKSPFLFRRLCSLHPCFVIFDEIHHAGDRSAWGTGLVTAFGDGARRRLCLSGTPFKHNGQLIPFLRVGADGQYQVDFQYDYPRALVDDVVREVVFDVFGGTVEIAVDGDVVEFDTDDDLDHGETAMRLRGLLHSPRFTMGLLRNANDTLRKVRVDRPNAGALVICMDTKHATRIADMLEEINGERPTVVVSDDTRAEGSIAEYQASNTPWLVAVKMVSEGVDIPRLAVLAYLTNATTELFFRQAVGRVVRRQKNAPRKDRTAYCVLPEDPRLVKLAEDIKKFQALLPDPVPEEKDAGQRDGKKPLLDVIGSSDPEYKGAILGGEQFGAKLAHEARLLAPGSDFAEAEIIRFMRRGMELVAVHEANEPVQGGSLEERMAVIRTDCARLANKLAYRTGCSERDIHSEYKRQVDQTPQAEMNERQLKRKKEWLSRRLAAAA